MKTHTVILLVVIMLSCFSCERELPTEQRGSAGSPQLTASPTAIVNRNRTLIHEDLNLIAKSMTGLLYHTGFRAEVKAAAMDSGENGDFQASLPGIRQTCLAHGLDIASAMQQQLDLLGESQAAKDRLLSIMDGFSVEGLQLRPAVFFPHLNVSESVFANIVWDGITPSYVTAFNYWNQGPFDTYTLGMNGLETVAKNRQNLVDLPGWFIKLDWEHDGIFEDLPVSGERFLARCYCVRGIPNTFCSSAYGTAHGDRKCGIDLGGFLGGCTGECNESSQ